MTRRHLSQEQLTLRFSSFQNHSLFSSHWLRNRLPLEEEWRTHKERAKIALDSIIKLWAVEKDRVEHYPTEHSLEYAFIQPILEFLEWKLIYQTIVRRRKPDYALFMEEEKLDQALQAGKDSENFWKYPKLLADAKAWGVSLDRPTYLRNAREYPPEQIEWYLNNTALEYAILTNGRIWRLIPRSLNYDQPRFQTYLEFNLLAFLKEWDDVPRLLQTHDHPLFNDFLTFYLFFSLTAYRERDGIPALIERAKKGSSEYRLGIGNDIKTRVFEALRISIEGFIKHKPNNLSKDRHLAVCREQSFILLYRLLFIMYAEDRSLLPYRINRLYTENRSLGKLRRDIEQKIDRIELHLETDYPDEATEIWDELESLFDLINTGKKTYAIPAYNGGLFNPESNPFLAEKKLPDRYISRVIDQLSRARDEGHPQAGLFRVDYRDLQIQHLGNIYESLLELHPYVVTEPVVVIRERNGLTEKVIKARETVPRGYEKTNILYKPGSIHLLTKKGERRASGSYYTPDHIVDYLVKRSLSPFCQKIDSDLKNEIHDLEVKLTSVSEEEKPSIAKRLDELKSDYDDRVLMLKIVDPAMGSGHFLLKACQYLAEEIATHPYAKDEEYNESLGDESSITYWKRKVVERCLYGVDKNPLAVELAKLALWLETVSVGHPLTFLDHHLKRGNSLVGARVDSLGVLPRSGAILEHALNQQWRSILPNLLEPLALIQETPSNTIPQIKEKEKLYEQLFKKRLFPFNRISDVWCSSFFAEDDLLPPNGYETILNLVDKPNKFREMLKEKWLSDLIDIASMPDNLFFHWELEFPDIFFGKPNKGFDVIIGNPPYDVLSEKEIGSDISTFKKYIEHQSIYAPSRKGKNNLYKLFICRALDLLADNGRLGLIVQMALLGDEQSSAIRKELLSKGAFTSIEAFPQKDDPSKRVFPEAKLATVAFSYIKTDDDTKKKKSFSSRVHPANVIVEGNPTLKLSSTEIPYYDSSNLAIVSCSQQDWDIAVRIMKTGRMTRLSSYCQSFQGEINETNEKVNGTLNEIPDTGPLVLRGSNVCLYSIRAASQGEDLYLDVDKYLHGKAEDSKAYHHQQKRIGFQRSSPQNNFRRIIAAPIDIDNYCFDTISYVPSSHSKLPLGVILSLLNSKLLDWYFRLGSTNSKVNEYQFDNLPCPVFSLEGDPDTKIIQRTLRGITDDIDKSFDSIKPLIDSPPFDITLLHLMDRLSDKIVALERRRGEISRSDRSSLCQDAQLYQDFIDHVLYAMANIEGGEAKRLEDRLRMML